MKATTQMQARLLELQDLDTRLNQLDHKMRSLPELTDIARLEAQEGGLQSEVVRTETAVGDLQRVVRRAEAAVQQVRDRVTRDESRLAVGTGTAKSLQGLQSELESLARRQGVLEDEQLEVMERVEAAESEAAVASAARDEHLARLTQLRTARDAQLAELTSERDGVASGRDAIAADLSEELLALYERVRAHSGMGAAALVQRRCGACRLELNAVEVGRIRSALEDEVVRCEECGRILVRTQESGL
ncbi:MAG: C4-type zinc ribbon domain-containing protein [Ornithinimicrobium sp.]|uniref:zinc ribbon domain-containing protein n=1 Tax=Ornithinimicrobium sp. TaxID=1977084 RepID=UPI0026DF0C8A|nr:C4-type zinc ribbon domain-containing protein [Ornithinimicrobium sp.]MDO5739514.1 C4-type zinc ribbon domain-containing protein [Ornithinimicrobium sp.]